MDDNEKEKEEEDEKNEKNEAAAPFEGWIIVFTGVFSVSKQIIKQVVKENGGRVTEQVNSATTHCCYSGRDGVNDWGKPMVCFIVIVDTVSIYY
jgi:NAD-dependent DNA ligase